MYADELRRWRNRRQLSQRRLAQRVHVAPTYISYMESGQRPGTHDIAREIDNALDADGNIERAWILSVGSDDPAQINPTRDPEYALQIGDLVDRRDFLKFATTASAVTMMPSNAGNRIRPSHTTIVTADDVTAVRDHLTAIRQVDERRGGAIGIRSASAFLSGDIAHLCRGRFATRHIRQEMFAAAARAAYLCGWKAHDIGRNDIAIAYYRSAQTLAEESGVIGHSAWVLRIQALHSCDTDSNRAEAVDIAGEAVRRVAGNGGHLAALMHVAHARCLAEGGEYRKARAALSRANSQLDPHPDPTTPEYAAEWCPQKANLLTQAANALRAMGEMTESAAYHRQARDMWDRRHYARAWGMEAYKLGESLWMSGDQSGAENAWRECITVLADVSSQRAHDRINNIISYIPELNDHSIPPEPARQ